MKMNGNGREPFTTFVLVLALGSSSGLGEGYGWGWDYGNGCGEPGCCFYLSRFWGGGVGGSGGRDGMGGIPVLRKRSKMFFVFTLFLPRIWGKGRGGGLRGWAYGYKCEYNF